jgi:dTDP-4-amino-4,6-dideoxygalactose transaminase
MIPLFKVRMSSDAVKMTEEVLMSGYIGQGPKVDLFEDILQINLNSLVKPVTVNSCTSALDLALELIDVGPGDEVISIPLSCFATQIGIIHRKAKIIWADIDPLTGLIDPLDVSKKITEKTKAIIGVNWAGRICDYADLKKHGIPVIEDAAHNWGRLSPVERGDYIAYSFQAIKFLTTGDGGCLITPPDKEHDARLLRWYGLDRTKGESFRCTQNIKRAGFKYHMNDINAVIGLANIPEANESVMLHKMNAYTLVNELSGLDWLKSPAFDLNCDYWLYTVLVDNVDEFSIYLSNNGIASSPVHFRNDKYDVTSHFEGDRLAGVDTFSKKQLSIPVGWWLSEKDLDHIIKTIKNYK